MDLMEVVKAEPSLQGTLIADLLEIMQGGEFAEVDEPVKPGEEVIDEMTKLERALYTLYDKYTEAKNDLVVRAKETCDKCACREADKATCKLSQEIKLAAGRFETVHKLMWGSIEQRLAEKDKPGSTGKGIRTGGQIVLMFEKQQRGLDLLGAILLGGGL